MFKNQIYDLSGARTDFFLRYLRFNLKINEGSVYKYHTADYGNKTPLMLVENFKSRPNDYMLALDEATNTYELNYPTNIISDPNYCKDITLNVLMVRQGIFDYGIFRIFSKIIDSTTTKYSIDLNFANSTEPIFNEKQFSNLTILYEGYGTKMISIRPENSITIKFLLRNPGKFGVLIIGSEVNNMSSQMNVSTDLMINTYQFNASLYKKNNYNHNHNHNLNYCGADFEKFISPQNLSAIYDYSIEYHLMPINLSTDNVSYRIESYNVNYNITSPAKSSNNNDELLSLYFNSISLNSNSCWRLTDSELISTDEIILTHSENKSFKIIYIAFWCLLPLMLIALIYILIRKYRKNTKENNSTENIYKKSNNVKKMNKKTNNRDHLTDNVIRISPRGSIKPNLDWNK